MTATTFPTVPDAAELFRRSQEATRVVTEAYTTAVQQTVAALPSFPSADALPTTVPSAGDAAAAVDSAFEYVNKAVSIQRDFAKSIATIATV
jgi:hypothetical protein